MVGVNTTPPRRLSEQLKRLDSIRTGSHTHFACTVVSLTLQVLIPQLLNNGLHFDPKLENASTTEVLTSPLSLFENLETGTSRI